MKKGLFALLLSALAIASAWADCNPTCPPPTVIGNLFPGSVITATDNCCITNTSYYVFYPATAYIPYGNEVDIRFQMTFTAPGTYNVDALALWELLPGTSFTSGTAIQATFHPKIAGQTCQPTIHQCQIVVPAGTSLTKPFVFYVDPFNDVAIDSQHNWVLALYFDATQPTGAAVAQGIGSDLITGAFNNFGGDQVTGRTTLPVSRDGNTRIFVFTGVQF